MRRLRGDVDVHAHSGPVRGDAVLCVDPTSADALPGGEGLLSVGVHPWNAGRADRQVWERMERWLDDPRVVAVGEIGFDRLRAEGDSGMDVQRAVFERQAAMAAGRGLPVIIHCVRAFDMLLQCRKETALRGNQWIVHGFRGKPALARQLLEAGMDLSFGPRYNAETYALTPEERRYRESDS